MIRLVLVLLVVVPLSAGANEPGDDKIITTSAIDSRTQPFVSPTELSSPKRGFLDENEIYIGTILRSHHFNKYDYHDYNEIHRGVYLSINQWSTGLFTNSADEQSVFISYNPRLYRKKSFAVNMVAGVANGYEGWENAQGEYLPILGVSAQWTLLKTILTYDAITFGLEVPLN